RGMVVLRSLGFQLVPFKLHRFRKQRLYLAVSGRTRPSLHPTRRISYDRRAQASTLGVHASPRLIPCG
ncbi:hypothetical protein, partial [Aeromonas salmonicida]|uniref:hypothetical protein n=1 Tax=Aeromonas salmonicida TaxID=645 RepID=UPI0031D5A1A5